jgi:hypothetical protein
LYGTALPLVRPRPAAIAIHKFITVGSRSDTARKGGSAMIHDGHRRVRRRRVKPGEKKNTHGYSWGLVGALIVIGLILWYAIGG